jgi:hypothetical protein
MCLVVNTEVSFSMQSIRFFSYCMLQVTTERKSFLPLRLRPPTVVGSRPTIPPMPSVAGNNKCANVLLIRFFFIIFAFSSKSPLTVGNRVLVNGLKNGILRYIGAVQFAQGLFCGVELDQPDGKHDGMVKDVRYRTKTKNHLFTSFFS